MLQNLSNKSTWEHYLIQQLEQHFGQTLAPSERERCIQKIKLLEPTLSKPFWKADESIAGICIILTGKVRLLDRDHSLITSLKVGNSFGELTLFPQESFTPYYARASEQLKIAYLDRELLDYLIQRHPDIEQHLHQQAILQELLLLSRHNPLFKNVTSEGLIKTLGLFTSYKLEVGRVPDSLLTTQKLWLLRSGEMVSSIGEKLRAGSIYPPSTAAQGSSWQVTVATELYGLSHGDWNLASVNLPQLNDVLDSQHPPIVIEQSLPVLVPQPKNIALTEVELSSQSPGTKRADYFPHPQQRVGHLLQRVTRRYPCFLQQSASDCGIACLINIGLYWGKRFNLNQLRRIANVGRHGSSLRGLVAAAESVGFATRPVKATLDKLAEQQLPAIAHWEGKHYITVYEVSRQWVIVVDPAIGQRKLSHAEFDAGWTGNVLLLEPTAQLHKAQEAKYSLGNFGGLIKPHWLVLLEILIISISIQLAGLITPIFTQLLIDRVVVQQNILTLNAVGMGLVIFSLFSVIMTGLRKYLLDHTANKIDLALMAGFIRHTFRLPLSFFESRYVGDLMARVQENHKIQRFLTGDSLSIFLDLLTVFIYVGVMCWYSWKLAAVILVIVPLFAFLALISTPILRQISREVFRTVAHQKSYLIEGLTGIRTVKSMAIEQSVRWNWESRFNEYIKTKFSSQIIRNRLRIASSTIKALATAILLWFGAWLVIQQELSIGQLIAFNMLLGKVISPFQRLTVLWNDFQEVTISVERINDVLEAEPEEDLQGGNRHTCPPLKGHIEFKQVCFRYHPESPNNILENLSFEIQPGQTIALVGRSGSGKTTIAKLILGLYTPTEGQILIDGQEITNIALQSLREQIGVVDQANFLFGSTIAENISIAHPQATQPEIIAAARQAGADQFIRELPLGYDTPIGEGGGNLSGGQRQRIAIARSLLGNPRLLILDEATSSLDAESERIIQNNLSKILRNRTSIVIAHRLSTIQSADVILVLDRGIIIESGTHQELMTKQGHYFYLNQQQFTR
ncbi:MAG: peptidase domain-containing ABC transporter [Cyanobacteria bacterium P01_A01_bin.83]